MIQKRKALDNKIDLKAHFVNIRPQESDRAFGPIFNSDGERIT